MCSSRLSSLKLLREAEGCSSPEAKGCRLFHGKPSRAQFPLNTGSISGFGDTGFPTLPRKLPKPIVGMTLGEFPLGLVSFYRRILKRPVLSIWKRVAKHAESRASAAQEKQQGPTASKPLSVISKAVMVQKTMVPMKMQTPGT